MRSSQLLDISLSTQPWRTKTILSLLGFVSKSGHFISEVLPILIWSQLDLFFHKSDTLGNLVHACCLDSKWHLQLNPKARDSNPDTHFESDVVDEVFLEHGADVDGVEGRLVGVVVVLVIIL